MSTPLRTVAAHELPERSPEPVDADTLAQARRIVDDVAERGEVALREHAERLGDLAPGQRLVRDRADLERALKHLPDADTALLERTAARIRSFAEGQRQCLMDFETGLPGGRAGHVVSPVSSAGCYAPGGRFPLPSSVLMTVVTARVAGVPRVWAASPKPQPITLAAAAVAGADALLAAGGAQAIAALAYGNDAVPACDVIAGPGNRWVTAAKKHVAGRVGIDMLAGPSELVVFADAHAPADLIAADLLAQAEHDTDALPILVTTDEGMIAAVNHELERQLADLPTRETATVALQNGFAVLCTDVEQGVEVCDRLAPEHLEVMMRSAERVSSQLSNYGALFIGSGAAEVLGDYGIGPNHVLPTGRTSRYTGGLSVLTFMRVHTYLALEQPEQAEQLLDDAVRLARLEGLEAHARAAEARLRGSSSE